MYTWPRLLDTSQLKEAVDRHEIIQTVRDAIASIEAPRFFETERGFQGELLFQLQHINPSLRTKDLIVEQEYQKRLQTHGLRIRPDIIIHEPFDETKHKSRQQGNFAVVELKRRAGPTAAKRDFDNLAEMLGVLSYQLAIFVNVDSSRTHIDLAPPELRGRLIAFAVKLEASVQILREEQA
jgi:hypothetical protein